MKVRLIVNVFLLILLSMVLMAPSLMAADPIKIGLVLPYTGYFEIFARQEENGFKLGLEYSTKGTNKIIGRDVKLLIEDYQLNPARGKMLLTKLYNDDKVDLAVGPVSSAVGTAMAPVAQEFKKLLVIPGAAADSLTGSLWNRYIFRTAQSTGQIGISSAIAIAKPGVSIATLVQDYSYGRETIAPFKQTAKKLGAEVVHEEYVDFKASEFTAPLQRIINALKDKPSPKYLFSLWAGTPGPYPSIAAAGLDKYGIVNSTAGSPLPNLKLQKILKGTVGAVMYYYEIPKNPVNDWFVKEYYKRHKAPPDMWDCAGFFTAISVVEGIQKAGSTDSEKLVTAMEGMEFMTPKGKMIFRKEDHQALQSFFTYKLDVKPDVEWAIPVLIREQTPEETAPPIMVK